MLFCIHSIFFDKVQQSWRMHTSPILAVSSCILIMLHVSFALSIVLLVDRPQLLSTLAAAAAMA